MRFFWAEDFNEGKDTIGKLEEEWRLYFDLPTYKTINKKDLNSMIQYLEEKKNFRKIDAFILDIRFPISESDTKKAKEEIYKHFYQKFITYDMYNNNIEAAPGLLLYLLLIFRYHIPLEKIVFISAHISDDNIILQHLNNMKEFMYKKILSESELTESDVKIYKGCANQLIAPMRKDGIFKDKSEVQWMSSNNPDAYKVIAKLDKLLSDHPKYFKIQQETDGTLQQYKQLKMQFNDMGLSMPLAFEKPKPNSIKIDKKYSFLYWEKIADSKKYNAVRSSIQEMSLILIEKMKDKLYKDFKEILTCTELETYDNIFFNRYLEQIMDLIPLECDSDESFLNSVIVKEIASVWENVSLPKISKNFSFCKRFGEKRKANPKFNKWFYYHEDPCFYASHSAMKIVRNWSGHQGINNINILDMGFIFIICMRGIFDIDELGDKKDEYLKHEKNILILFDEQPQNISIDLSESLKYFKELNNVTLKKSDSNDIYERISGLGNTESKIRLSVSMDEIYMLYFHTILKGINNIPNTFQNKAYKNTYEDIYGYIKSRTWNNWKQRYNNRFQEYYLIK